MELYIVEERHTTMYQAIGFYRKYTNAKICFDMIVSNLKNTIGVPEVNTGKSRTDKQKPDLLEIVRCGHEVFRLRKIQTQD